MAENVKNNAIGIVVDDGYKRVPITNIYGDEIGVFYFNPTDLGIIDRYNKLAEEFDNVLEPLQSLPDGADISEEELEAKQVEALNEATERLYKAVNELFGGDFASAFFGKTNPFSPVNGTFYCEQALNAVGQFISAQFDAETKKFAEHVKKYTQNRAQRRAAKKK